MVWTGVRAGRSVPAGPTRRTVLAGAALVPALAVLTACTSGDASAPEPSTTPDPDLALRAAAQSRIRELVAACAGLALTDPTRAASATAVQAQHEAHLAALAPAVDPRATPGATKTTATATPTTPTTATTTPLPPTPGMTLASLLTLERAASTAHAEAARTASPQLAQVFASISAGESTHEIALAQ